MKLISPPSLIVKTLEENGYTLTDDGWRHENGIFIELRILHSAGEEVSNMGIPSFLVKKDRRQLLIELMRFKQQILHNAYCYQRDLDEIGEWSLTLVDRIFDNIIANNKAGLLISGSASCVFCIAFNNCEVCTYGQRHGKCKEGDSDYQRYCRDKIGKSVIEQQLRHFLAVNF